MSDLDEMTWADLKTQWRTIKSGAVSKTGKPFEKLILSCFKMSGAEVFEPYNVPASGPPMEQIDGMVIAKHVVCLIEAKDLSSNVNIEPIAKLRNQLSRRPAGVIGSVFVTSDFTDPALTLANYLAPHAILLWNGFETARSLRIRNRSWRVFSASIMSSRELAYTTTI